MEDNSFKCGTRVYYDLYHSNVTETLRTPSAGLKTDPRVFAIFYSINKAFCNGFCTDKQISTDALLSIKNIILKSEINGLRILNEAVTLTINEIFRILGKTVSSAPSFYAHEAPKCSSVPTPQNYRNPTLQDYYNFNDPRQSYVPPQRENVYFQPRPADNDSLACSTNEFFHLYITQLRTSTNYAIPSMTQKAQTFCQTILEAFISGICPDNISKDSLLKIKSKILACEFLGQQNIRNAVLDTLFLFTTSMTNVNKAPNNSPPLMENLTDTEIHALDVSRLNKVQIIKIASRLHKEQLAQINLDSFGMHGFISLFCNLQRSDIQYFNAQTIAKNLAEISPVYYQHLSDAQVREIDYEVVIDYNFQKYFLQSQLKKMKGYRLLPESSMPKPYFTKTPNAGHSIPQKETTTPQYPPRPVKKIDYDPIKLNSFQIALKDAKSLLGNSKSFSSLQTLNPEYEALLRRINNLDMKNDPRLFFSRDVGLVDKENVQPMYKKMCTVLHPDKNPERTEEAKILFQLLGSAYDLIK